MGCGETCRSRLKREPRLPGCMTLKPHVTKLVVCDPRKNASMREGNQSDKIDARQLAELLRLNHLHPVYHGEHGLRSLKELVRSSL
jgi:hypothetical protein